MRKLLGWALFLVGFLLLTQFVNGRSQLAAFWIMAGGLAGVAGRAWTLPAWLLGWAFLMANAPGIRHGTIGCESPAGLAYSPFNLITERDLSTLGIDFFYAGSPRVKAAIAPIYAEMEHRRDYDEMTHAVACSADDLFGLGPTPGQLFYYRPDGRLRKQLLFLHGAMGNLQCYTSYWQTFAEQNHYSVTCPGFGFGFWNRPGGVETAASAVQQSDGEPSGALVICLSNGAMGGVRLTIQHPELVDQLVLISPVLEPQLVGSPDFAKALKKPPLVLEGTDDLNVRPEAVERGIAAMRQAGIKPIYQLLPGHDHFLMFSARTQVSEAILKLY